MVFKRTSSLTVIEPRHTSIIAILPIDSDFIILEDYCENQGLEATSLLYRRTADGKIIWEAKPHPIGFLAIIVKGGKITTYDGTGTADLDPDTGELTNWVLTK